MLCSCKPKPVDLVQSSPAAASEAIGVIGLAHRARLASPPVHLAWILSSVPSPQTLGGALHYHILVQIGAGGGWAGAEWEANATFGLYAAFCKPICCPIICE